MSATGPLATVWGALDRHGCEPHGEAWDFRARCPAHNGGNRDALHVSVGAGGRAVLRCFAHQCAAERIVAALELSMSAPTSRTTRTRARDGSEPQHHRDPRTPAVEGAA